MRAEVVTDGVVFGEGPVWVPEGTPGGPSLVVTSVAAGSLVRISPDGSGREDVADTGGGPNGAALVADGSFLVTQNGGLDFSKLPIGVDLPFREADARPPARTRRRRRALPRRRRLPRAQRPRRRR